MKSSEAICKEIHDRIVEYKGLQMKHNEDMGWRELESAIIELQSVLEWANE
jgi:hypothetical protein